MGLINNMVSEFTEDSHLQGNRYFRVVHGKTDKSHSVGLHRHEFVEIFWVRSGMGMLLSGGKQRYFSQNFLYISKPNELHVIDPEGNEPLSFTYVAIARRVFEDFVATVLFEEEEAFKSKFGGISVKLSTFETSFLNRAASELAWQDDSRIAIFRFLLNIYWQIKNAFVSALPGDMPAWLSEACQRVRNPENLCLGLTKFREICGKDMSYINRAMRRHMNCTPTEFINSARLSYAKWLLETSSFSTGEISESCGFSDLPYFCRKFRDKYECTPTQFRREVHSPEHLGGLNDTYKMRDVRKISI